MLDPLGSIKTYLMLILIVVVGAGYFVIRGQHARITGHAQEIEAVRLQSDIYKEQYSKLHKAVVKHEKDNPNCLILSAPDGNGGKRRIFPWFNSKGEFVMPAPICNCVDCQCTDCNCMGGACECPNCIHK